MELDDLVRFDSSTVYQLDNLQVVCFDVRFDNHGY